MHRLSERKIAPLSEEVQTIIWKKIQRWSCAVLIVNLRSVMRDMTLNFKLHLSVSYRGKLCIWKEIKEDALYDRTNNVFYNNKCKRQNCDGAQ